MGTSAAPAVQNPAAFLARITRDQRPESEQVLNFNPLNQISTPTSLRTDKKVKWYLFHFRGRLTNGSTGPTLRTAPPLLGTQLFALVQQFDLRGVHLRYGGQTPIIMRGELAAEFLALFYPNYIPLFNVSQNGGAVARGQALDTTANHTNDVEFALPIPTFPPGITAADVPFYCLHGPDWPGNLYFDILCADGTSVATANAPTISAYGSSSGSATVEIQSERALVTKGLMARIRPAITFRIDSFQQPTQTVSVTGGTGVVISDLTVGKDTTRLLLKTGTQQSGTSGTVVVYGSLLDSIVTRSYIALDLRQMGNSIANSDITLQDYQSRTQGRTAPIGYKILDFIATPGDSPANPKAAFQSSALTAARKFQLQGDVTASSNQIADVVQEMLLGTPAIIAPGSPRF